MSTAVNKIETIVCYEPGSGFLFPEGGSIPFNSSTGSAEASSIPMKKFMKLTKIPIVIYYDDNIHMKASNNPGADGWSTFTDGQIVTRY
jgi:hypothetical protein